MQYNIKDSGEEKSLEDTADAAQNKLRNSDIRRIWIFDKKKRRTISMEINQLINHILDGNAVLFLGAGFQGRPQIS
jgi:hypothetical protein